MEGGPQMTRASPSDPGSCTERDHYDAALAPRRAEKGDAMKKMNVIEHCGGCIERDEDMGFPICGHIDGPKGQLPCDGIHPDCHLDDAPDPDDIRVVCEATLYRVDTETERRAIEAAKRLLSTIPKTFVPGEYVPWVDSQIISTRVISKKGTSDGMATD